jgi:hypothetical protein
MGNALAIRALKRLMPPAIYTDYQYTGVQAPFPASPPNTVFTTIASNELMSPNLWKPVLRTDANVALASSTLVKRMQVNLRYTLATANWVQITTFIVTLRKDATDRVIDQGNLALNKDYISSDENFNVRLNPDVFKVHFVRNVSLAGGAWKQDTPVVASENVVAQTSTTFAKGQVNIDLGIRMRQPLGQSWTSMDQTQFGPQQRYFLLTFFKGDQTEVDTDPVRVDFDVLYTAYNAS